MQPTALTHVSQQTGEDVMSLVVSDEGYRRIEHVSNGNSAFSYESSTNGAYFERGPYSPEGIKGPSAVHPTQDREPIEDVKECLKEPPPAVGTEEITHSSYYQHTPSSMSTQSPSPWQPSKFLATGYWPPTTAPPPVVDMFFRPTLRHPYHHNQHHQQLPQPNPNYQIQGQTDWIRYEDTCQYNPGPYQTEFYSDSTATYGLQPMGSAGSGNNHQWDSQNANMRAEDVVVSGRFQLQLEVQARIRRGETGATTTTTNSGTSNITGGGYLPNGPNYGMATYNRNLPGYIEQQQYRIEDGQFVGN